MHVCVALPANQFTSEVPSTSKRPEQTHCAVQQELKAVDSEWAHHFIPNHRKAVKRWLEAEMH